MRKISAVLYRIMILLLVCAANSYGQFAGGSGTEADPWQIETAEHLHNMRNYIGDGNEGKHFIQIADIDLYDATRAGGLFENPTTSTGEYDTEFSYSVGDVVNDASETNYISLRNGNTGNPLNDEDFWYLCNNHGWEPIGSSYDEQFLGNFDGAGYSITGMYLNRPIESYVGLFGAGNGTITNLNVENADVTGVYAVGSLIGSSWGTIDNCSASGDIKGTYVFNRNDVGGLVGVSQGYIGNSSFTGSVSGIRNIGGLVGSNYGMDQDAIVENSFADAEVFGSYYAVGGLVGYNAWGAVVRTSYSRGNVSGAYSVGGLVGANHLECTVENSYSMASVTGVGEFGSEGAGGLVGANDASLIINSYSTGSVTGEDGVGGLVGKWQYPFVEEDIINSYWNTETTNQPESYGGLGRTTAEMTYPYATGVYAEWDFDTIWSHDEDHTVNDGYPHLGFGMPTSTENEEDLPRQVKLHQNYPNPFNPVTTIQYELPQQQEVRLEVYNVLGRRVAVLVSGTQQAGYHTIQFDASRLASGMYLYRLQAGNVVQTHKMMLIK